MIRKILTVSQPHAAHTSDCESVSNSFLFHGQTVQMNTNVAHIYIILTTSVISQSKTFNRRKFNFIRIFQLLVLSVSMDLHETAVAGAVAVDADFNSSLPQNPSDMKL